MDLSEPSDPTTWGTASASQQSSRISVKTDGMGLSSYEHFSMGRSTVALLYSMEIKKQRSIPATLAQDETGPETQKLRSATHIAQSSATRHETARTSTKGAANDPEASVNAIRSYTGRGEKENTSIPREERPRCSKGHT